MARRVVFDFDGVIHSYKSGWKGIDVIPDPPVDGIKEVIDELRENNYEAVIVSTRTAEESGKRAVEEWLRKYDIEVDGLYKEKPPALVYIDDRALRFDGNCKDLVNRIKNFKSWTDERREPTLSEYMRDRYANREDKDNIFNVGISDAEFRKFAIKYLLGDDWYVVDPLGRDQINEIALYEILEKYSKRYRKERKADGREHK